MNRISIKFFRCIFIFLFLFLLINKSYSSPIPLPSPHFNNLHGIHFKDRKKIENIVDELIISAKDPYAASLPLIASARLGDKKSYAISRNQMLNELQNLNKKPSDFPQWMRSNSFKAWMLGRVLLSADAMKDNKIIIQTKNKLSALLKEKITPEDNFAFYAWAQGYLAALNKTEYKFSKKRMMSDAFQLSKKYEAKPTDHAALSDALWAWVMNLSASANANDPATYEFIKKQIQSLTDSKSISQSIESGLLRTSDSNDYPAWALAKIRLAAAMMRDQSLYQDIDNVLPASIKGAKKADAKAEYILAVIDNQLAIQVGKELKLKEIRRSSHRGLYFF